MPTVSHRQAEDQNAEFDIDPYLIDKFSHRQVPRHRPRNRQVLLLARSNDYFLDDVNDYYDYETRKDYFRYFPDVDYVGYFLHAPKTPALPRRSPLSGVEPEDPLFPRVHPNPNPYTYMPYFL